METAVSILALGVLFVVFMALRHVGDAAALRVGAALRGKWLGLLIFVPACIGAALFCFNLVLDALSSGEIHCFGRRCSGDYQLGSNPVAYWLSMAIWSFFGGFFVWVIFHGIKRFIRLRAGEP